MLRSTRRIRRFIAGRVVGCGLSVVVAACSKDTTAPLTPSLVTVTSGANQSGTVNATLTQPIAVLVTDSNGRPVSGVAVTFTPNTNAGSVSSAQATTERGPRWRMPNRISCGRALTRGRGPASSWRY